ncbi:MAG: MFS transporter [Desulfovibrionaceae bacterium]|nr:MFS transporter [Desulfovibrionaceae bacterium]
MGLPGRNADPARWAGRFSWALYDWANSAFCTLIQTFVFAAYFTRAVAENETLGTAQWGSMMGLAGLAVGLGGPLLGAVADQTGRRKPWIAVLTLICVVCTGLLFMVRPEPGDALPALVLVGLATIASEYANIFYNAMLPDLAPAHRLGRLSGWAWGLGYAGGLACLVLALAALVSEHPWLDLGRAQALNVRATALLTAAWYLVFSLPLILFTPDAPSTGLGPVRAVGRGLRQLAESLAQAGRHRPIMLFLLARMVYNDGLTTMFAFGGIFAAGTFGMSAREVLVFGIGLNLSAGLGSAVFAWMDDRVGARRTILVSLVGLAVPGALMLVAWSKTVFWVLGLALGLFVGPLQASSRSWLARAVPEGLGNQMFGLFALSGKLTSFLGPFLVGWLTLALGSQRFGMASVIVMFVLGFGLMLLVPKSESGPGG